MSYILYYITTSIIENDIHININIRKINISKKLYNKTFTTYTNHKKERDIEEI